jgi:hypothetical protein
MQVIKKVPAEHIEERIVGRMCDTCGCGWSGEENAITTPCDNPSCDGTQFAEDQTYTRRIPGYLIIRCDCKREVVCDHHFTNSCECGADYDSSGNRLAPREFWGEETGETYADIVSGYDPEEVW